jgi:DNA polymerase-1
MNTLFLIDAFAIIYRAYYAHLHSPLRNSKGIDTSVPYGFMQALREVMHKENPTHLGVAFDMGGETFRHLIYPAYKANRSETPDAVLQAVPIIEEILNAFGIPILRHKGYEADDIIGTLAVRAERQGFTTYMMTPDKDYGQLVTDKILIYKPAHQHTPPEKLGRQDICKKYGIEHAKQVIDILAIWGDASDNVPGAPGIGEKGAMRLVAKYGSVEGIIAHCHELSPKQKASICENTAMLLRAKELVTIDTNAPVEFNAAELLRKTPNQSMLQEIFTDLEFRSFLREYCGSNVGSRDTALFSNNNLTSVPSANNGVCSQDTYQFSATKQTSMTILNNRYNAQDIFSSSISKLNQPPSSACYDEHQHNEKPDSASIKSEPTIACKTIKDTPHKYHLVQDSSAIAALCDGLNHCSEFCFDTETSGLNPMQSVIVGISFCMKAGEAYYIPLNNNSKDEWIAILKAPLENPNIRKIGQNIKFDYLTLKRCGIQLRGALCDTMLMHYLLDPEGAHNMNQMAQTLLGYSPIPISELIGGRGRGQGSMLDAAVEQVADYAAEDADITMQLYQTLQPMLQEHGFDELYQQIEAPLIYILGDMEYAGVCIDSKALGALSEELTARISALEQDIRSMTGIPALNVNSPRQLGDALFDKLQIVTNARTTSKSGQYSTSEETLAALKNRHPIVPKILEMRSLGKLLSSYVDTLPALVNDSTGRIHTCFNQAVTATGRLSSANPNLQNIPVRDEEGKRIRRCFVASDRRHLIMSADYSQVELRLMAHLSGDENLIKAFHDGMDVHAATAAKIYGVPLESVTPSQRRNAKTANFGIIYGISAFGLSQRLEIPRREARILIDGYFAAYPRVRAYMDEMVQRARRQGYVETLCGRRRMLPAINSTNAMARGFAERNAINAPIQGSAADIIKIAMIKVAQAISQERLRSQMLLQVHDELVFDVPKTELEAMKTLVKRCMEHAYELKVPLLAQAGAGSNWLEGH